MEVKKMFDFEEVKATAERIDSDSNIFAKFVRQERNAREYIIDEIFPLSVQKVDNVLDEFMDKYGENSTTFDNALTLYNNSFELGLKMGYIYGKFLQ